MSHQPRVDLGTGSLGAEEEGACQGQEGLSGLEASSEVLPLQLRQGQEAGEGNGREGEQESSKRLPGQMEREQVEEDVTDVLTYWSFGSVCV